MGQNELMIGDWVQIKDDLTIVQIKTHWDVYNAKEFEPVPITHEILEKNEFLQVTKERDSERYDLYGLPETWNEDYVSLDYTPSGAIYELQIGDAYAMKNLRFYIRHVHELQHALRLCKIDKEIKL